MPNELNLLTVIRLRSAFDTNEDLNAIYRCYIQVMNVSASTEPRYVELQHHGQFVNVIKRGQMHQGKTGCAKFQGEGET
jgi:hypothetical protein